jgi:hypothetical protein
VSRGTWTTAHPSGATYAICKLWNGITCLIILASCKRHKQYVNEPRASKKPVTIAHNWFHRQDSK